MTAKISKMHRRTMEATQAAKQREEKTKQLAGLNNIGPDSNLDDMIAAIEGARSLEIPPNEYWKELKNHAIDIDQKIHEPFAICAAVIDRHLNDPVVGPLIENDKTLAAMFTTLQADFDAHKSRLKTVIDECEKMGDSAKSMDEISVLLNLHGGVEDAAEVYTSVGQKTILNIYAHLEKFEDKLTPLPTAEESALADPNVVSDVQFKEEVK
jgi:hypothetical protein